MKKQALFLALVLSSIAGNGKIEIQQHIEGEFHLPVLVHNNSPARIDYLQKNQLSELEGVYIGKFKWTDTLLVTAALLDHRSWGTEDELDYLAEERNGGYLETDGLQLFPDYNSTVAYTSRFPSNDKNYEALVYYPVYLVNETNRPKFYKFDSYKGCPLQEAMDDDAHEGKNWRPMESSIRLNCINSNWNVRIQPGEFVLFLLPKYFGTTTTALRVRMKNGPNIIVSKSFLGLVNPKQLKVEKGSWQDRYLKTGYLMAIDDLFYGATPKGYEIPY